MKKTGSIVLMLCIAFSSFSQDYVVKKSGERIKAKVVEIDGSSITFKLFDNQEGPNYKYKIADVTRIEYQNGSVETFGAKPEQTVVEPAPVPSTEVKTGFDYRNNFKKNLLSFDFFSIILNEINFSYERIVNKGTMGIKIPIIIGLNSEYENRVREYPINVMGGLDLNFYPTGQGRVRYFVGPGFRLADVYDYYNKEEDGIVSSEKTTINRDLLGFQINNGVIFQPSPNFNISLVGGVGIRKLSSYRDVRYTSNSNYGSFSANIAFRF